MKSTHTLLLSALTLGATSMLASAQDPRPPGGGGGPGGGGRPMSPIIAALDTNKDGEIDMKEIEGAVAALKALDKNGDGKLSGEDIRPPRGDRGPGGQGGDRPGGQGGGNRGQGAGGDKPKDAAK